MKHLRPKTPWVLWLLTTLFAMAWYQVEPWALTFVDDGPYYSTLYTESIDDLPVQSKIELQRFGTIAYTLESRVVTDRNESVFVLRTADDHVLWGRRPNKPDGELGYIKVRGASLTWNMGWRVRIAPEHQESGSLYIGPLGGFRFFNHSW